MLEKMTKIIKSNHQSITTMPTDDVPQCHIYPFKALPLNSQTFSFNLKIVAFFFLFNICISDNIWQKLSDIRTWENYSNLRLLENLSHSFIKGQPTHHSVLILWSLVQALSQHFIYTHPLSFWDDKINEKKIEISLCHQDVVEEE